jgi:hypothetical protein
MTQQEFNKEQLFHNLINQCIEKDLPYWYILEESKRSKWNLNPRQIELISDLLNVNNLDVTFAALDLGILNVDNRTKKVIEKQRKRNEEI